MRPPPPRCRDRRRTRRGAVALEMLLVLPVFLVLLLGFVELTSIVLVEERLAGASNQGARVAAQGGTVADVEAAVDNYLGPGRIRDNLLPVICDPADPTTAYSGSPVKVRVEVEAGKVVPDLLRMIGFSLSDQVLVGQTVLRKE